MNILRLRVGIRPEPEEDTFVTVVFHDPQSPPLALFSLLQTATYAKDCSHVQAGSTS
jgi:hypothetical protein